jgi:hypothetical protein
LIPALVCGSPKPVPNAKKAFEHVDTQGLRLSVRKGILPAYAYLRRSDPNSDPNIKSQFKGIQRFWKDSTNYFLFTGDYKNLAQLLIAKIDGESTEWCLGSNLTHKSWEPSQKDSIVRSLDLNKGSDLASLIHAGGFQIIDHYAAIPLSAEKADRSAVVFVDLSSVSSPKVLPYRVDSNVYPARAVGITTLKDGRFLMVAGSTDYGVLDFYVSEGKSLDTDPSFGFSVQWTADKLSGNDEKFGKYKSLNLFRDEAGDFWMVGFNNSAKGYGQDWVDLFSLSFKSKYSEVEIKKVEKKHMMCQGDVDFDVGGAIYFDPSGEFTCYGISRYLSDSSKILRLNEFPNRGKEIEKISDSFIAMYDDRNFSDRCLQMKGKPDDIKDFKDAKAGGEKGFGDKVSSVRYHLPKGYTYILYEDDNYRGEAVELNGTGYLESIADLKDKKFNDKTSSSKLHERGEKIEKISDSFIALYDDRNFSDRCLKMKGKPDNIKDFNDATASGKKGFGDKVSSLRYHLPKGYTYILYEDDNYKGDKIKLRGTGYLESIDNLNDKDFNDKTSSSKLEKD